MLKTMFVCPVFLWLFNYQSVKRLINGFNRPPYGANDIDQEEYDIGGRHRPQRNRDRSQNL